MFHDVRSVKTKVTTLVGLYLTRSTVFRHLAQYNWTLGELHPVNRSAVLRARPVPIHGSPDRAVLQKTRLSGKLGVRLAERKLPVCAWTGRLLG